MENNIAIFNNEEFGAVRTISENGRILFCAKDVAVALGYSNPRKAVADHCKGVTKRDTLTEGGVQSLSYIPEGDVYRLIVSSKLPSAARFETWLFDTVVPDIRRHGAYISDPLLQKMADNPGLLEKIVETMMYERKRADSLTEKLNEAQPKADYFDSFVNPANCTKYEETLFKVVFAPKALKFQPFTAKTLSIQSILETPQRSSACRRKHSANSCKTRSTYIAAPPETSCRTAKGATTGFLWCVTTTAAVISEHTPSSHRAERTCSVCCLVRWECEKEELPYEIYI